MLRTYQVCRRGRNEDGTEGWVQLSGTGTFSGNDALHQAEQVRKAIIANTGGPKHGIPLQVLRG